MPRWVFYVAIAVLVWVSLDAAHALGKREGMDEMFTAAMQACRPLIDSKDVV